MNGRLAKTNTKAFVGVLIAVAVVVAIVAVVRLDTTGKRGSGLGEEFSYDLTDLGKIAPNLILYKESAPAIDTGFTNSRAIAVDSNGSIYVAGDKAIRKFAESANLLGETRLADMPRCLTVAGDGRIYVGFKEHVEVYDAQGKRLATWQRLGNDAVLTSIAVSKNDVFVADAGNRIVHRFDTTGKLINRIGGKDKDKNIPGFVIPSPHFDLAVGHDGLLRVVNPGNHRIEAYTFVGDLEFSWGTFSNVNIKGFCGCCNPVNFAILDDDSFVTCEKGLVRIKIYDPAGVFVGAVAGPEQLVQEGTSRICETAAECQTGSFDVAVDTNGRIFVLDTIKNVVRIFTRIKEE
ncbi:MAG TPA: NHL repeat-containing protein [Sedimentisphaerales bacterium]|nr:NHL repeat-containing protein [Sedimentisphaerales bacterium]